MKIQNLRQYRKGNVVLYVHFIDDCADVDHLWSCMGNDQHIIKRRVCHEYKEMSVLWW